jgi:hypothetical protein
MDKLLKEQACFDACLGETIPNKFTRGNYRPNKRLLPAGDVQTGFAHSVTAPRLLSPSGGAPFLSGCLHFG